ncbi:MAG TPA: dihydrodipicolinate synthase family protein [Pirellulales bacterium]|nr:dihydrodipicolinate synthase family protein [Pirellulales bacterium]
MSQHTAPNIEGIFVPNMAPLDEAGEIDEAELRRYADWLIDHGAHGLYPNGSTGEFTRFTPDERRRIVHIVCQQARGKALVLAGAAETNVRETLRACETYLGYGARAVAIVAPYYYKLGPESVFAYFREIARHTPIDVTLYNIPLFASPIDVTTLQRLAEFPRVIGIKDSSGDMAGMLRMMAAVQPARPDFVFLSGWEAALAPMLMMGCQGGTNATSGVAPEITRKIYDLVKEGRFAEARALQLRLLELFDALVNAADFPEGFRIGVQLRGIHIGRSRQPLSERQQHERPELERKISRLLTEFGLHGPNASPQ